MSFVLRAFGIWNWITDLYGWILNISKRYIQAISDAHVEEVYCFLDTGLPLIRRFPPTSTLWIYTPSIKRFSFDMKSSNQSGRIHRYNLLSARLIGPITIDLSEFFAEVTWTGSTLGPAASQAVIATMLDRGVHLTSTCLVAYTLQVEDDTGTPHTITDFSQPLNL
jgi:hypothetical protein